MPYLHPLNYRAAEIGDVYRRMIAGDSCVVVGVSGVGKTNFAAHLTSRPVREAKLSAHDKWLIASLSSNAIVENDARAPYEAVLAAIARAVSETFADAGEIASTLAEVRERVASASGELVAQRLFIDAVGAVMRYDDVHLVIVWDQFDRTFAKCSGAILTTLRQIRDSHKYRLSYVVLARELLPYIRDGPEAEEFIELVHADTFGLGTLSPTDAVNTLSELAHRYGVAPAPDTVEAIFRSSGRHGGLLRSVYIALAQQRLSTPALERLDVLLQDADIRRECEKLWKGLHPDEQHALPGFMQHGRIDNSVRARLLTKRILNPDGSLIAPLFAAWLAEGDVGQAVSLPSEPPTGAERQATSLTYTAEPALRVDAPAQRAWIGPREITGELSALEYKLLALLAVMPEKVYTRDEILQCLYPNEMHQAGTAPDDARADNVVRRLRQRLRKIAPDGPTIETVRGRGYRLQLPASAVP